MATKVSLRDYLRDKFTSSTLLVLSFVLVIFIGSILLFLPFTHKNGISIGYLDALFTAVTSTCVTGLMTVNALNTFNIFGQIIILLLIQIGGLGLMTFVAQFLLLAKEKLALKEKKTLMDSLNKDNASDISGYIGYIFKYVFTCEIIGFICLSPIIFDGTVYSIFQTLFLSISAFCNAGIDIFGYASLTSFGSNVFVNIIVECLIIMGGLGFSVFFDIRNKLHLLKELDFKFKPFFSRLKLHTKMVFISTIVLIISGFVIFFSLEYNHSLADLSFFDKIQAAWFDSVTLRTAGFFTTDFAKLANPTKLIMIIFMLIGASPGGTGGGIKTTTVYCLVAGIIACFSNRDHIVIFKRHISNHSYIKAVSIALLYIICLTCGIAILSGVENFDFIDLAFEAASAIGTVGLSTGITSSLCSFSKVVIIILMFVGRLGPITIALLFKNKERNTSIKYPKEEIIVG